MESQTRKGKRVPLPYMIRPHRKLAVVYNSLSIHDDFHEYSSINDSESSSMKASEKGSCSDQKDEEYVVVEALPNFKTGAIPMEVSKDEGSNNDDWVVV